MFINHVTFFIWVWRQPTYNLQHKSQNFGRITIQYYSSCLEEVPRKPFFLSIHPFFCLEIRFDERNSITWPRAFGIQVAPPPLSFIGFIFYRCFSLSGKKLRRRTTGFGCATPASTTTRPRSTASSPQNQVPAGQFYGSPQIIKRRKRLRNLSFFIKSIKVIYEGCEIFSCGKKITIRMFRTIMIVIVFKIYTI